jgi:hypothetical protein
MAGMRTSLLFATGSLLAGSLASMVWVTRPALKPVVPVAFTQPLE